MIYIIDNDSIMAECIADAIRNCSNDEVKLFSNAIDAMQGIAAEEVAKVKMIFLDIMLDGPDGFTFLNELMSYSDTAKIPVVIVTTLKIKADLSDYGVVRILDKSSMVPDDIRALTQEYANA